MANVLSQQKAIIFNTSTNQLNFTSSAPIPTPSDEHLIRVHSTAITNGELTWGPFVDWPTEHVPCYDVSGTILSTVPNSPFQIGDKVYGRVSASRKGTARQYGTILPSEAALVPKGLGMLEAASVPMSAHTAWQALFEHGLLTGSFTPTSVPHVNEKGKMVGNQAHGKRVLILGAAGTVGLMAVQFAKLAGAWVAGTASPKNSDYLKALGINEVINYTHISMQKWIGGDETKKFDLVFDCVGGASMLDGWTAVKPRGTYVSVAPGFKEPEGGKPEGVRSKWFIMDARGEELGRIGKLIEMGCVKGCVDSVWEFEEFEEAFRKTGGGHARGKVVLRVADE